MTENPLLDKLESSQPVYGVASETCTPAAVETLGAIGLDFVWVDFEHAGPSPYDALAIEELTRAAEAGGTELLVRLPSPDPHLIRKVLDAGVRTILVSRIETAAEIKQAAAAAAFTYENEPGNRGVGIGRSTKWGASVDEYVETADDSILLGAMVETAPALENLENILSVSGLGFVFVGPADLSVSLGEPMKKDHPDVCAAIEQIETTVTTTDVALGGIRTDPAEIRTAVDDGYQVLRIGSQLTAARTVISDRLGRITSE